MRRCAPAALLALAACAAAPRGQGAAGLELGVMTFNIRYGTAGDGPDAWPARQGQLVALLRREAPDVIGFQEALRFQLDAIHAALPGYGEAGVGRDDGRTAGEYAAIMFRRDRFRLEQAGTFWFSDTPAVPGSTSWGNRVTRICTWARLRDRATGGVVSVYNVHLDHESQASREHSVALLLDRIQGGARGTPVIVTGDFNAGETNPAVAAMTRAGWRDAHRVLHPADTLVGTYHAFRGDSTGEKIDYVFVPPGAQVVESRIVRSAAAGRYPSDHFPVMTRVRL